ncbi:MAG TPA: phosphatase PAP2 family protein [Solirubrobacterales bacterium]
MGSTGGYCAAVGESVKRSIAGCLACLTGLMLLTGLVYDVESLQRLDAEALQGLSAARGSPAAGIAALVMHSADLLPLLVMLALACGMALHFGRRRDALAALILVAGANLTTQILKAALAHPRYEPILGYRQIGSASFPSGHATAGLSIALAFVLVVPRSWRPLTTLAGAVFALAVACSVLVLNRHFPSDVLGGWLVAGAWFFAVLAGLCSGAVSKA